ncbi:GH1 family beta-glucosidase [Nitratireductor aquimarinus]|uniref:GH1 family beta-glucosidase n=1 Tax=Nitratireductor aquimarinus TaxID=889300 RepID=UPI0029362DEC|nr:GH1 family beta-glucosidase [Nitratireductor aquimarinus]MDV2967992.1 GH1 family beta-glucosidase [Nitratireductor aquimarinus]
MPANGMEAMELEFSRDDFPGDFVFGTATSSYQIEGSRFGGCGTSHWDTFAATPGNTVRGEDGATACDHYHRWESDLDLVRDAGFDCYRFSISWSRVLPDGRGDANPEGLDFYDRLVDGMLERGLKPFATLYHWDLPAPLADLGGWRNRDIASWFADYAELVMKRIGDRVATAATINEPWCVAWLSHFMGAHAPGLRDIRAAARAMHHVLLAHGRATQAMRALGMDNLGLVTNFEYAAPADDSEAARKAARLYDGIYNRWFLGGVFDGAYPEDVLEGLGPHMPQGFEKDFGVIGTPVDWLGINYYTRKLIAPDGSGRFPALKEVKGPLPKTFMDWEIYPDGLHHFITWAHENYTKGLPIYVTENGMAAPDRLSAGQFDDPARIDFLNRHLGAVRRALDEGAPVKGYIVWSLLDNYEWALGYEKRFGLVHVDFETLERTPKASWHALGRALKR